SVSAHRTRIPVGQRSSTMGSGSTSFGGLIGSRGPTSFGGLTGSRGGKSESWAEHGRALSSSVAIAATVNILVFIGVLLIGRGCEGTTAIRAASKACHRNRFRQGEPVGFVSPARCCGGMFVSITPTRSLYRPSPAGRAVPLLRSRRRTTPLHPGAAVAPVAIG